MRRVYRTDGPSTDDIETALRSAWSSWAADGMAGLPPEHAPSIAQLDGDPFDVEPEKEGFGVVELILIAASGRLLASVPERIVVRIFDEYIWPRLQARFGRSLRRDEDGGSA